MSIKFTYLSTEIELPSPQLGDVQSFDFGLLTKRAMSGAMYTHKKTPVTRRLSMDFVNLSDTNTSELLNLYLAAGGQNIIFKDWRDRTWIGRIVNNPFEYTVLKNYNTIHIDFEGINYYTEPEWVIMPPSVISFLIFPGIQYDVAYYSNPHVYLAGYTGIKNMHAINVSNPLSLSLDWDSYMAGACYTVKRVGAFVFWGISGSGKGVYIYDLINPALPNARGSILTGFHGFNITADTNIAYCLSASIGSRYLYRYNISNKDIPSLETGFFYDVDVDGANNVEMYSLLNPDDTLILGGPVCTNLVWVYVENWIGRTKLFTLNHGGRYFKVVDNYLCVCSNTGQTFKIFEFQTLPTYALVEIGSCNLGTNGLHFDISGDYAFVATGSDMKVINIANKTNPFIEFTCIPPFGAINSVAIGGENNEFAYFGRGNSEGMGVAQVRQLV